MISLWKNKFPALLLLPLAWIYGAVIRHKNTKFDEAENPSRSDQLVFSVGNITVGGTGKTPLTIRLVKDLQSLQRKPAVLSRGYGRKSQEIVSVQEAMQNQTFLDETGDEPALMAGQLPGVPILVGANRNVSLKAATERWPVDTLVLDDAMQHRQCARDVEIVVIDAMNPFGNGWLIPAGPLREPLSELKRADAIVLSRCDQARHIDALEREIRKRTDAPIFRSAHQPQYWIHLRDRQTHPIGIHKKKFVYAFAGIGNPKTFQITLKSLGLEVIHFRKFPDHYAYTQKDLIEIYNQAQKMGALTIVTTEKDGVKIRPEWIHNIPAYALSIATVMLPDDASWKQWLNTRMTQKESL